jgi:hypothetical protein
MLYEQHKAGFGLPPESEIPKQAAAAAAGIKFVWAAEFFGWD